jgi:hypothetical protein
MEKSKKVILCVALAIIAMVIVFSANVAVTYATPTTQEWFDLWHLVDWTPVKGEIAAIKVKTDSIVWTDVSIIKDAVAAIKAKTDLLPTALEWTDIKAIYGKVDTEVADILADTVTINWADVTAIDTVVDAIKAKTDTIVWTDITTIDTVVDAIKLKTDTIVWTDITAIDTVVDLIKVDTTDILADTATINWADVTDILSEVGSLEVKLDSEQGWLGFGGTGASSSWSTTAKSGGYSVNLTSGTATGSSYANFKKQLAGLGMDIADFSSVTFWYRIDATSTIIPGIEATWPMYVRSADTVTNGYFSPYIVLNLDTDGDGDADAQLMSQQWAEPAANLGTWMQWKSEASKVYSAALWHDGFVTDPGIGGGVPAFWGPLSFWKTEYAGARVIRVGIYVGFWGVDESQNDLADTLMINGMEYKVEPSVQEVVSLLTNPTYGLAEIKAEIIVIDGLVDAIKLKTDTIVWTDITAIDTVVDAIKVDTTAILADTATIVWGDITAIDTVVDAIKLKTDTIVWTDITAIDTVVDAIKVDTTAILTNVATVDTVVDAIKVDTTAILADTNELQTDWTDGGRLDLLIDAIKVKTDSIVWTDISIIKDAVAAIKAKTDLLPTALEWTDIKAIYGKVDTEVADILADTATINWADVTAIKGYVDTEVADIKTAVETNIPATLTTIAGYVDTEVAAIKAKTDSIGTFTNTGGTAELGAIIGDVANVAIATRLTTIAGYVDTEVADILTEIGDISVDSGRVGWTTLGVALDDIKDEIVTMQTDVTAIKGYVDTEVASILVDTTAIKGYVDDLETRLTATRAGNLDAVSQVTEFDGSAATSASAVTSLTGTVGTDGKAIKVSVVVDTDPIKSAAAATSYVDVSVMIDGANWRLLVHQDVNGLVVYTTDFTAEKFKVEINRGADGLGAQTIYFSYVYETAP